MSPLEWVKSFAGFAGVAGDVVQQFTEEHPELIDEHHPDAPPPAPTGDIDPDVAKAIDDGNV